MWHDTVYFFLIWLISYSIMSSRAICIVLKWQNFLLSHVWKVFHCVCVCAYSVINSCLTFCNPMDHSPQASLYMGFSRQEYWSGLPFPLPGTSWPRDQTCVSCFSCTCRQTLYHWATWEVPCACVYTICTYIYIYLYIY